MPKEPEDYEVGYCRPPKHPQWKKGQSGNPHGRPKRPNDLVSIAERVGKQKQTVRDNGKVRTITLSEMVVRKAYQLAIVEGKFGAIQQVDKWNRENRERLSNDLRPPRGFEGAVWDDDEGWVIEAHLILEDQPPRRFIDGVEQHSPEDQPDNPKDP